MGRGESSWDMKKKKKPEGGVCFACIFREDRTGMLLGRMRAGFAKCFRSRLSH